MNFKKQNLKEESSRIMELMGMTVISEQTNIGKVFGDKLKIRKKGDNDWRLVAKRGFQFDKDNLKEDDKVFQYIKLETGISDLTPDRVVFSTRKDGKNKDVYAFMVVPQGTSPQEKAKEEQNLETKVVTDPVEDDAASSEIYNIKGDNIYDYMVIDNIWHFRKKGDKEWTSLETNEKANTSLDNKFPDARKEESTSEPDVEEKIKEMSNNCEGFGSGKNLPFPTCKEMGYDDDYCETAFLMYNNQPGDFETWQNYGDDATGGTKEEYLEDVYNAITQIKPLECQYEYMKKVNFSDEDIIAYAKKFKDDELLLTMSKGTPEDAAAGTRQTP